MQPTSASYTNPPTSQPLVDSRHPDRSGRCRSQTIHHDFDSIDNLGPSWSRNIMAFTRKPQQRPLPRLPNDRFPHLRRIRQILLVTTTLFSDGIHIFDRHSATPPPSERILWRASSPASISSSQQLSFGARNSGTLVLHRNQTWELIRTMMFHPSQVQQRVEKEAQPEGRTTATDFRDVARCFGSAEPV